MLVKISLTGGFEPPTFRLTAERSTDWATRAVGFFSATSIKHSGLSVRRFLTILFLVLPNYWKKMNKYYSKIIEFWTAKSIVMIKLTDSSHKLIINLINVTKNRDERGFDKRRNKNHFFLHIKKQINVS